MSSAGYGKVLQRLGQDERARDRGEDGARRWCEGVDGCSWRGPLPPPPQMLPSTAAAYPSVHGRGLEESGSGSGSWLEPMAEPAAATPPPGPPVRRDMDEDPTANIFYIATHEGAWNEESCSVFSRDSALLDYGESFGGPATYFPTNTGGHPRFSHLGWAFGGEFAMYCKSDPPIPTRASLFL